jgi:hypothetical protein
MQSVVVNIFGAPGAGKSSFAALVFTEMKRVGANVELVTEVAKDLVYRHDYRGLKMQFPVAGVQYERVQRLVGQVEFIITDSPVLLSSIYAPDEYPRSFHELMSWAHQSNPSVNVMLPLLAERYRPDGRIHNLEQAQALDHRIDAVVRGNSPAGSICLITALTMTSARRVIRKADQVFAHISQSEPLWPSH